MKSEDQIHKAIVHYIRTVLPGCLCWHPANGGYRTKATAAKLKSLGVMPGVPDLQIMLPGGQSLFAEIKTHDGKISLAQRAFHEKARNLGFIVAIWRSMDDVKNTFQTLGIETRESRS